MAPNSILNVRDYLEIPSTYDPISLNTKMYHWVDSRKSPLIFLLFMAFQSIEIVDQAEQKINGLIKSLEQYKKNKLNQ